MLTQAEILARLEALVAEIKTTTSPSGSVTTVAQLDEARRTSGRYMLADGTYRGNFNITADDVTLEGGPGAVLTPLDLFEPTLSGYRHAPTVRGLTVLNGAPDRECIVFGDLFATSMAQQPSDVLLENLRVVAGVNGGHRGIALHGANMTVRACSVENFWEKGRDSQAVWICNGIGPYLIEDCHLEASGENILTGGADPRIVGLNPTDIIVRRNTLLKPVSFFGNGAQVKNSFELKLGLNVLFEDNIIDGWKPWPAASPLQRAPIQITVRNQEGTAPWSKVDGVVIRKTIFQNVSGGYAVNIQGTDNEHASQQTDRVSIIGNLFAGSKGFAQVLGGVKEMLLFDHNTAPHTTDRVFSFDNPGIRTPLTFTNNVVRAGTYGVSGNGDLAMGLPSLQQFCDLVAWAGNVLESKATLKWPTGQVVLPVGGLMPLLDPTTFKMLNGTAGY